MSSHEEGMLTILACIVVVEFGLIVYLFIRVIQLIRRNENEIFRLDVLIESVIEVFNNRYKFDEDEEEQN